MKAKNIGNLIKSLALSAAMCAPLMAGIGFGDNVKAAENWVNIHRLCSKSGVHRYTTDGDCYKKAEWGSYNYEGIAYRGVTDPSQGVPVYEMLRGEANSSDPVPGSLLSTDQNEVRVLNSKYRNGVGWFGDKVLFYAPKTSDYPVHRLFYPRAADPRTAHHYTADANEIRVLVTQGWNDEGIVFYSAGPGEAASISSGSNTIVSSNAGRSKELEDAYFEELNKIRVSEGLKPYIRNAQMDAAAGSRLDFVIDYYDSGKAALDTKEKAEFDAKGIPYVGESSANLTYDPHKGAKETFNKYVNDPTLRYGGENTAVKPVNGTASYFAINSLSSTKSFSEANGTLHWPNLMGKSDTQIGIAIYVKNGNAYQCVMFAGPSDGSLSAGWHIREDGVHVYVNPFYPGMNEITDNYYLPEEREEWESFQNMKFQEWMKNQNPNVGTLDWLLEFRKMKDNK